MSNAPSFDGKTLEKTYPNITSWVKSRGWIEVGRDGHVGAFVSALDDGGLVWKGDDHYETLDEAFRALEAGIAEWMEG